ncbi:hypothetical protein [Rhodoferax sp.]|uniref:hypothetical protein n=1 Tax=Rhodoferax sp. TaxID=50421 RepID=UPI0025D14BA5|nr:hypothetical protein [Rhodoferax sp.]
MPFSAHSTVSESIQGTLVQHAGQAPDADAVVDAVTRTWQFMAAQLEPVIGARGTSVLLDRALHLTAKNFPWLAQTDPPDSAGDPLARLQVRFARRDAQEAAQAGCALLVTFTEQLASLIGEPLTERLLASVWVDSASPYETHTPHG